MSEEKATKPQAASTVGKTDDELAELLDSALQDFGAAPKEPKADSATKESKDESQSSAGALPQMDEQAMKAFVDEFQKNLSSYMAPDNPEANSAELVQAKIQEMAQAAQQVLDNPVVDENSTEFASAISQTIQGLTTGRDDLNGAFENDILNMFGNGTEGFVPFMQGMMQSLLSKDVLYPSLKDIIDKFPAFLEEHKDKLSAEDKTRYEKQQDLMKEVCGVLDDEKEDDTFDVKKERFDRVLGLMQRLQEYGQPPTELVGELGGPMPPMDPNQCPIA